MSTTFTDLGLPAQLVSPLRKAGINHPFPIQEATIPDALAGRDVCGRAPTGSGKTLAFGLPLLAKIGKARPHRPTALVLSPTRELAEQIRRELAPVAAGRGLRLLTVYGGVAYHPQRTKLRRGVDVLVACPGRLLDLIEQGEVSLEEARYVVVDEADRMADMGFLPQVRKLLDMTPNDRQTLLFSATLDGDIATMTKRYQTNPVRHEVGGDAHDAGTARHHFWRVERQGRVGLVADVAGSFRSTLVFTRTRRGADRLAQQLGREGIRSDVIHGGRSQRQRDRALRQFKNGQVETLVATDVAARGIHVDGVECVVHFDPPEDQKAYLHRSGRTARAGADGHVVSLVQHDQVRSTRRLQRELGVRDHVAEPTMEALFDSGGELLGQRSADASPTTGQRNGSRRSSGQSKQSKQRAHTHSSRDRGGDDKRRPAGSSRNRTNKGSRGRNDGSAGRNGGSAGRNGGSGGNNGQSGGGSRGNSRSSNRSRSNNGRPNRGSQQRRRSSAGTRTNSSR